jgi:16S rRNA (cytosine1402-N4)-methyltransferase
MHKSVLLDESLLMLNINKDSNYIDMTFGAGGHSSNILKQLDTGYLYSFDVSDYATSFSEPLKKEYPNFRFIKDNFVNAAKYIKDNNITNIKGVLFDLGLSSMQIDNENGGFSYMKDTPLDMRMDNTKPVTAASIINTYSLEDLTKIFLDYGEERNAYRIAKKIIYQREIKPILNSFELVEICDQVNYKAKGHSSKKVFQALRIATNDELTTLTDALESIIQVLPAEARIVVITFHSLEDRIVKHIFNHYSTPTIDKNAYFQVPQNLKLTLINKHPIIPTEQEMEINPRSRSAKLRGAIVNF